MFLSVAGVVCWGWALGVRPSPPWGESAALKRGLLGVGGVLLQVPVALVVVHQPPYVTGAYTVESFDLGRLVLEYVVVLAVFAGIAVLARWLD